MLLSYIDLTHFAIYTRRALVFLHMCLIFTLLRILFSHVPQPGFMPSPSSPDTMHSSDHRSSSSQPHRPVLDEAISCASFDGPTQIFPSSVNSLPVLLDWLWSVQDLRTDSTTWKTFLVLQYSPVCWTEFVPWLSEGSVQVLCWTSEASRRNPERLWPAVQLWPSSPAAFFVTHTAFCSLGLARTTASHSLLSYRASWFF